MRIDNIQCTRARLNVSETNGGVDNPNNGSETWRFWTEEYIFVLFGKMFVIFKHANFSFEPNSMVFRFVVTFYNYRSSFYFNSKTHTCIRGGGGCSWDLNPLPPHHLASGCIFFVFQWLLATHGRRAPLTAEEGMDDLAENKNQGHFEFLKIKRGKRDTGGEGSLVFADERERDIEMKWIKN